MVLRVPAAVKTGPGSRIVRAWAFMPAAVNERDAATGLPEAGPVPRDLLADKGFDGQAFAVSLAARGTAVLISPIKTRRRGMPPTSASSAVMVSVAGETTVRSG